MEVEISHFIIHIFIYFGFGFLLVNVLTKFKVLEEMHAEIAKVRNRMESVESHLGGLTDSINNNLMINESRARTAIDIKDK